MAGNENSGRQIDQKLKSLMVWYYLCRNTDENNFVKGEDIAEDLYNDYGISAERRSIYRDIKQLNTVLYMMDNDCSLDEALDAIEEDPECVSIKNIHKKGFYLQHQSYDFDTVRLLAESVYSAKFIDDTQMKQLINIIKQLISNHQIEKIEHDVLNIDHTRTKNKDTFFNVSIINDAMSPMIEGQLHTPEKITFKYMKYSINDLQQSVAKRGGRRYTVSPYKLIISDGNYYLRCYDDEHKKMLTFRVDRMKDVKLTGQPRSGREAAAAEDYKSYTKRVFSMFGGKKQYVRLLFINSLLDTVVDRFGNEKVQYHKEDDHHFSLIAEVEISPQFFSWLCGLGTGVTVLDPPDVREEYKKHLEKILKKY